MWLIKSKSKRGARSQSGRSTFQPRLEALEDRYLLSAGALDPTFGSGGTVTTSFGNINAKAQVNAQVLVIQPDGKIVAAGDSENSATLNVGYYDLARYNPDGSLDNTFGSKGEVQAKFGYRVTANAIALQPDGKILLAGRNINNGTFEIVRYNSNGSLDSTFGDKGVVNTSFGQGGSQIWSLDLETIGGVTKIVAAGDVWTSASPFVSVFGLARYNLDGSLDGAFGSGGKVVTNMSSEANPDPLGSAVQGDGKIVLAGEAFSAGANSREFALARYNTNGSLDATFGGGGLILTPIGPNAEARAVALQPDGKIVAGGWGTSATHVRPEFALSRYNPDGSLDTSFGSSGVVLTPIIALYDSNDTINGLAIQPGNGQIIAVGWANFNSSALVRYNPDGSLDATFGSGGIVAGSFGQGDTAVALQADGKIVTTSVNNGNFGLARYLPSEPQIASFTASPNPVTAGSSLTLTASNITDTNPNVAITQVAFYLDRDANGILDSADTLLGYATQTSPGIWTFSFTVNLAPGTYTLFAQAEDSYGVFGDPFAITLTDQ
jgi:uncharacterized delta-60 repeat protein